MPNYKNGKRIVKKEKEKKKIPKNCLHTPGNSYWQNRKRHGRKKNIETPQILWELACEYFENCDNKPWMKNEAVKGGDLAGTIMEIPTQRPYTWSGFENFLYEKDIIESLENYRYNIDKRFNDFVAIIKRIGSIIYTQKFEGATVGAFNANIIARDLGLVEKTETKLDTDVFKVEIKKKEK